MTKEPVPVVWHGQTYLFALLDQDIKGKFQRWQEAEAARAVEAHRASVSPDWYVQQLEGLRHDLGAKVYRWGMPASLRVLGTDEGLKHLVFLHLRKGFEIHGGEEVERETVDRMADDEFFWEHLGSLCLEHDFPNLARPAANGAPPAATSTPTTCTPSWPGATPSSPTPPASGS